jgi:cation diffusion facilitator CzcD-associated flavoprotein CzcO
MAPPEDMKVLIVGAGMMGINAGIKLQQAGFDYTIVEAQNDVGGNWLVSTYPGAAVDTPSILYSYSFDPNPSWTRFYPVGPEFLAYLQNVANRHNLYQRIQFGTFVHGAKWDEARQLWTIEATQNGEKRMYEANILLIAAGPNNRPKMPPGVNVDVFEGAIAHTAEWDSSIDLKGKKVVQVGVGCSGVQLATAIADEVSELNIIMRQPEYIIPNEQARANVDPLDRAAQETIPFVAQWRRLQGLASAMNDMKGMMSIDPEWQKNGGRISQFNDAITDMSLNFLKSKFPNDPEMVQRLTPDYPLFAKRPILDCGYYDVLQKPNVKLITGALAACEKDAVILADGTRIPSTGVPNSIFPAATAKRCAMFSRQRLMPTRARRCRVFRTCSLWVGRTASSLPIMRSSVSSRFIGLSSYCRPWSMRTGRHSMSPKPPATNTTKASKKVCNSPAGSTKVPHTVITVMPAAKSCWLLAVTTMKFGTIRGSRSLSTSNPSQTKSQRESLRIRSKSFRFKEDRPTKEFEEIGK